MQCRGIVYQICSDPKINNPSAGHPRVCRNLNVLNQPQELQLSSRYCGQHFSMDNAQRAQTSPYNPASPEYSSTSPESSVASPEGYSGPPIPRDPTTMGSQYLVQSYQNRYVSIDARDPCQEAPFNDEVQSTIANPPSTSETPTARTFMPEDFGDHEQVLATFAPESPAPPVTSYQQRQTPAQSREPSQHASANDELDSIMADPLSSTGTPESRSPRPEDFWDHERVLATLEHGSPAPSTQGQ